MNRQKYDASPAAVAELLSGGGEFMAPERLLGDLSEKQAFLVAPRLPYSVAQITGHRRFWQERQLEQARGEVGLRPTHNEDTFAAPPAGGMGRLAP